MSSNLEDLSNDEIRIKLMEYGFPNLPVTLTTRKVLVKKLKNAMETQKTKNRRDTIAVIKNSDDEDITESKKRDRTPNRRATIAVTEKTKKVQASSSSESIPIVDEKPKSRRSSRATPLKDHPKPIVSSSEQIVDEESDDDIVEIKTYTRRSKTPTMTKSETVRTSYKNAVETVSDEIIPPKKRIIEDPPQPIIPIQTTTRRKTYTSTAINSFELPPRIETPTKFGKSTLTTSFNPSGNYRFEKEDEDNTNYNLDENDTPYLSNFAKRLSTLKAEPLDVGLPKPKYVDLRKNDEYPSVATSSYKYTSQYSSAYQPTRRPSVVKQMAKDFNSFDRKYSIRKYVYITLIIMLIIAIYVLLFL